LAIKRQEIGTIAGKEMEWEYQNLFPDIFSAKVSYKNVYK